jgi:uncharacterized protein
MEWRRRFPVRELLAHRSLLLLGPRQTGKSTLLRTELPDAVFYDLLEADTFRELSANPERLRQRLRPSDTLVVIDEVQKLPAILDEVHTLIERNKALRFVLTGSSARKLRRANVNLLAGRAWTGRLHPLVSCELESAEIDKRLSIGSLPSVFASAFPYQDLREYVGSYLAEEIRGESLTRAIEPFSRFLNVAGLVSGEILNFTSVGSDAQVPPRTVREYFSVLVDTLVGHMLEPYQKTKKRKPVATAKFYWFDIGVANAIVGRKEVVPKTPEYGRAFEHLIFLELRAYLDYRRIDTPLTFWRTQSHIEVDFVVGDLVAIEAKGTGNVAVGDTKGLLALGEEVELKRRIIVCNEANARTLENGIEVLPLSLFLERLWNDEIVG